MVVFQVADTQRTAPYHQRRPEATVLHQLLSRHLEDFLAAAEQRTGQRLPKYVENELRQYLKCGLHEYGFARARCHDCGHELLLPFSCKRRGVCPSCNGRRMNETAARAIEHILPDVPLRQWVLSVPYEPAP